MADYGQMIGTQLQGAEGMGFFSPMGSPQLRAALQRRALRLASNQRRKGTVLSQLLGLGPQEQRQAMVDVNREASGGLAGSLNEAEYQQLAGSQDWLRSLLGAERGREWESGERQQQRQWEESQRGGIGSMLGQIAGTGLGALVGGYGTALGERLGRGGGSGQGQLVNWLSRNYM